MGYRGSLVWWYAFTSSELECWYGVCELGFNFFIAHAFSFTFTLFFVCGTPTPPSLIDVVCLVVVVVVLLIPTPFSIFFSPLLPCIVELRLTVCFGL